MTDEKARNPAFQLGYTAGVIAGLERAIRINRAERLDKQEDESVELLLMDNGTDWEIRPEMARCHRTYFKDQRVQKDGMRCVRFQGHSGSHYGFRR